MYHCLKLLHPTLHLLKCVLVSDIVDLHPCLLSGELLMHYAALYRDILCRLQRRLRGHIIEGSGLLLSEGPSQEAFSSRGYHSMWSAWRIEAASHTHTQTKQHLSDRVARLRLCCPTSCSYMPLAPEPCGAAEDEKGAIKPLTSSAASASL